MKLDIIEGRFSKGGVGIKPKTKRPLPPKGQCTQPAMNNIHTLKFPSDEELHNFVISRSFLCYDDVAFAVRDYISCKLKA